MKISTQLEVGKPVPSSIIDLFIDDMKHLSEWRDEAIEAFDFVAGRQWTDEEAESLKKQKRPVVVFNRAKTVIDAVSGNERGNRREVRYIPREMGDVQANEVYTAAGEWFRDQSQAEDEESDSFSDMLITGLGWTETRIDFDMSPDGSPAIDRIDPLEMIYDRNAKKANLKDARHMWRFRLVPHDEISDMIEGFQREDMDARWTEATSAKDYGYSNSDARNENSASPDVTIVQLQWKERQPYYKVIDPMTGQIAEFKEDEFDILSARMAKIGVPLQGKRFMKTVFMQAILGHLVLKVSEAPSEKGFSFTAITGYRDRNKGTFYGMVRAMKDPQTWANKWLSQTMHIMNTNAKGGLMAEKGAFEDQAQAEKTWSDPTKITWLADGALAQGRIKEKTAATLPVGFQQLTEFGVQSIRDVTGVSLELLGMREAKQAASLEYQRRQSGMTILQPLFDGLKRYRETQGAVMLDLIKNDLSDGRIIRIVGKGKDQYIPLMRQADIEYDIIVDDAPTSPNQKEMVWQMFTQLLPIIGKTMPPQFMMQMLEYSPLPSSVVEDMRKMASEPNPMAEQQQKMQMAGMEAEIEKTKSETAGNVADARKTMADAQKSSAEAQQISAETAMSAMAQFAGMNYPM